MESDLECRVCRGEAEKDRPLLAPCLCSGSIMFCHQDCLEEWLLHSKKDKCELCNTKYLFKPEYDPDMPEVIPLSTILLNSLKKLFKEWFPLTTRMAVVIFLWLCVMPFATSAIYCWTMHSFKSYPGVKSGILSGLVLAGTIALTFIVLVRLALLALCVLYYKAFLIVVLYRISPNILEFRTSK